MTYATDKDWEYYGKQDPYFGVLTSEKYKKANLSAEGRREFFQSGEEYISSILRLVHEGLDPTFETTRGAALDFGCGVGRLVLPFSKVFASVTGVDISDSMLEEARRNCREEGVSNVDFVKDVQGLSREYDFIHSCIVFQHIAPERGESIIKVLVEALAEGGIGVLQLTYYRKQSWPRRLAYKLATLPVPLFPELHNLVTKRPLRQPVMQMNEYDLNHIFGVLQGSGCHRCVVRFTQHGNTRGVILLFQKKRLPSL